MAAPTIWLFRNATAGTPYAGAFQRAGYSVQTVPVLDTEYLEPESVPDGDFDAILVTSQRSVTALTRIDAFATRLQTGTKAAWYAVGAATGRSLLDLGINALDSGGNTGTDLARTVIASGAKRVLFLAGDPHRPEMTETLRSEGIEVEPLILYRTHTRVPVELVGQSPADWAVFFSPRGAETALSVADIDWHPIRRAAIGPTTANTLSRLGWPADVVASSPDPESLFQAVDTAYSRDTV